MNVGIMCGSSDTASMESRLNNSRAVSEIADMGYTFVMGAGETGFMRDVKEILRENGNMLITVGNRLELNRTTADVKIEVGSTFERAGHLYENSDVIIFLDGGTGTMAEFYSFLNNKIETNDDKTKLVLYNKEGYYNINADAVIIATGGFSANDELLKEYAPGSEVVETSNQMGATGDFIEVFKEHDLKLDHMDDLSVFKTIITNRRDLTGGADDFILVNKAGERFIDENSGGLDFAHAILDQEGEQAYYLYDQEAYESFYRLRKHVDLGYHTQADSLEELAEALNIDSNNLMKTVDEYNKVIENKEEDPFRGEDISERKFAEEGPYYGVPVESAIHMTKGGVVADEKAQVINNSNEPVEGLYAAGEVTDTSGAYSASVIFGKISGREAGKYILGQ